MAVPVNVKLCAMVDPVPGEAPIKPDSSAVQVKIVPGILLVNTIAVVVLPTVQKDWLFGVAVTTGPALIVTVDVATTPGQLPLAGILFVTV